MIWQLISDHKILTLSVWHHTVWLSSAALSNAEHIVSTVTFSCRPSLILIINAVHLIDVWNLIEAYRENGLNAVEPYTPMTLSRLETLLATLYIHLNKRVPAGQQVHIHPASLYLLKWIISIYNL